MNEKLRTQNETNRPWWFTQRTSSTLIDILIVKRERAQIGQAVYTIKLSLLCKDLELMCQR